MIRNSSNEGYDRSFSKYLQYLLARGIITLMQWMPVRLALAFGRSAGWVCWRLMKRRRETVRANLELVHASMVKGHADGAVSATKSENADALLAQVREVFLRAGANLMCGFRLSRMSVEQQGQHIKIEGAEHLQAALAKGKGAILLLAHMGPWESLSALGPLFARYGVGAQIGAMYRPLNNDYLEEWYREQRQRLGTRMYSRRDGFHNPVKHLRSGGILGILADQKMREGVEAPFFGRMFKTNPIPGLFHRRSGAPIVRLSFFKTDSLSWILRCNPVEIQAESLDRASLARICNQGLERSLLESPNDCFWFTAL